jgi:hypothetical protein
MSGYVPRPNPLAFLNLPQQPDQPQGRQNPLTPPWAYAGNPVGTETTQGMGMPQGPFNQVQWMRPDGTPVMAGDMAQAHGQVQTGMELAPTIALGMVGDAPGSGLRISTRIPTAKGLTFDPHTTPDLTVGLDSSRASGAAYDKNADLIRQYPGIPGIADGTADAVSERLINHATDNILHLHDSVPEDIRPRSGQWYDGANAIANRWADQYGITSEQASAALASLSPQKDWFQNVDLTQRILDTRKGAGNMSFTPEMRDWMQNFIDTRTVAKTQDRLQAAYDAIGDKPFSQVTDPYQQALWTRAYDQAHNPRGYSLVTPEGDVGGPVLNQDGSARKVGWGSMDEIAKAHAVLNDGSLSNISQQMGENHKVRNFYNNIVAPNAPNGDVTVDTHAIAAAHLRPLAGTDTEVSHGLGVSGSASNATGSQGMYGLYAEAYRRAAEARGILPREMQSITWEGVRGLFSDVQKRDANFRQAIDDIWNSHQQGQIDAPTARRLVFERAGGINPPEWHQPNG